MPFWFDPIKLYLSKYSHYFILGLNRFPLLVVTGGQQLTPLQHVVYVAWFMDSCWLLFSIKKKKKQQTPPSAQVLEMNKNYYKLNFLPRLL